MNQNFYNSNSFGSDQSQIPQFPVIHPPPQETSIEILHDHESVINSVQTFLRKLNRYSFFETPKVLLLAWDRVFEIKDVLGTTKNKPEDLQELFRELSNDMQNIHEELAEYINTPGWNRPAFNDDDDDDDVDYTIAITPNETVDSLIMGDKHLDTISATESDELIKSSVENLRKLVLLVKRLLKVNAGEELMLHVNFNEKYTKCLLLLVEVKAAGTKVNAAIES
nr:hypothetical protein [Tanacetum cinerariifolium]